MRVAALIAVVALPAAAQELSESPYNDSATDIDVGRASFRLRCSACHGIHAEGGKGPALDRGEFQAGDTDVDVYRVIADGVAGTEMPAFGGRNTEESIWRIVSYLRSFEVAGQAVPTGDAGRGEAVFWGKGGCGGCHKVGTRGGRYGPALTRIGRSRSLEHLKESVVAPDEDLPLGYYAVRATTKQGARLEGIGLGYDDFSAQFIDASGTIHSYFRDEVASLDREFRSLMPAGYAQSLSAQDLDDLFSYLVSLRGDEPK